MYISINGQFLKSSWNRNLLQEGQTEVYWWQKQATGQEVTFNMSQFQSTGRDRSMWSGGRRVSPVFILKYDSYWSMTSDLIKEFQSVMSTAMFSWLQRCSAAHYSLCDVVWTKRNLSIRTLYCLKTGSIWISCAYVSWDPRTSNCKSNVIPKKQAYFRTWLSRSWAKDLCGETLESSDWTWTLRSDSCIQIYFTISCCVTLGDMPSLCVVVITSVK